MHSSIIHNCNCSLIHKKYLPKSNQSDVKYHMTLNIIFEEEGHRPFPEMLASEAATLPPQRPRVSVARGKNKGTWMQRVAPPSLEWVQRGRLSYVVMKIILLIAISMTSHYTCVYTHMNWLQNLDPLVSHIFHAIAWHC